MKMHGFARKCTVFKGFFEWNTASELAGYTWESALLYIYRRRVKVLDVFWEIREFF